MQRQAPRQSLRHITTGAVAGKLSIFGGGLIRKRIPSTELSHRRSSSSATSAGRSRSNTPPIQRAETPPLNPLDIKPSASKQYSQMIDVSPNARLAGYLRHSAYNRTLTLLQVVVMMGDEDVLELLLKKNHNVNRTLGMNVHKVTALHIATKNGDLSIMAALIKKGAHVDATNASGQTPLHYAAASSNLEAYHLLVNAGADVNVVDDEGHTPHILLLYKLVDEDKLSDDKILETLKTAETPDESPKKSFLSRFRFCC